MVHVIVFVAAISADKIQVGHHRKVHCQLQACHTSQSASEASQRLPTPPQRPIANSKPALHLRAPLNVSCGEVFARQPKIPLISHFAEL